MLNDFLRALGGLRSPYALFLLFLCLLAAGAVFFGLGFGAWYLITESNIISLSWLEDVLGGAGVLVVGIAAWFMFPAVVTAFAGLILDPALAHREKMDYPALPPSRPQGIGEQISVVLRLLRRALFLNSMALPFYFFPVVNVLVYFLVNSKLLAHDYFLTVALRRMPLAEAEALYAQNHWTLARVGLVSAGLFAVPVVNIFAPLLSIFMMLHFVMRIGLANPPSNMLPHEAPSKKESSII